MLTQYIYYASMALAAWVSPDVLRYIRSSYRKESGVSLLKVLLSKGTREELQIYRRLEKLPGDNLLMANLYIPVGNGETTEIDLLMINRYGLFVIEAKNWGGKIIGNEKDRYWKQRLGLRRHSHYNPAWQNSGHISALQRVLGFDRRCFRSLIVFSDQSDIKKVKIAASDLLVINERKLKKKVRELCGQPVFSDAMVESIYNNLRVYSHANRTTKNSHIKNVKQKQTRGVANA